MAESSFAEWVQTVLDKWFDGNKGRLADAIGVKLTTLSRGMDAGTMGADTLLRLSLVAGRDPSEVLRLANKGDWADLIEQCYGVPRAVPPAVRELIEAAERLPERVVRLQAAMLASIQEHLPPQSESGNAPLARQAGAKRRQSKPAVRVR